MATNEELWGIQRHAINTAMDVANERDGFASSMSRESINAGLRAVYNAGLARALEIAREEKFVIARVAAAIEAERGQ